jgi:hypothetical protein
MGMQQQNHERNPLAEEPTKYSEGATAATGLQYQISEDTNKQDSYGIIPFLSEEIRRYRGVENKLRKEIKKLTDINNDLNIKNAKLNENLNNYKSNKLQDVIVNILSVIFIGIGVSTVSTNLQSMLGWVFILIGVILYLVSIRPWEYLNKS